MKTKTQVSIFSIAFMLLGIVAASSFQGCSSTKLASGGVYAGKANLYAVDSFISTAYDTESAFLKWESTNRPLLSKSVTAFADDLRKNAKAWNDSALALRDAYAANPTPENEANLQKALGIIRAALTEATKYLAEGVAKS